MNLCDGTGLAVRDVLDSGQTGAAGGAVSRSALYETTKSWREYDSSSNDRIGQRPT